MLAHEHAGRAGMVEMDVAEQQVADVGQLQAARRERRLQRVDRHRGPAVEERGAVFGVEQVAGDRALDALL